MVKIGGWSYRPNHRPASRSLSDAPERKRARRAYSSTLSRKRSDSFVRSPVRSPARSAISAGYHFRKAVDSVPLHRVRLKEQRRLKRKRRIAGGCAKKKGGQGGLLGSVRALGYQTSTSVSNLARMFSGKAAVTSPLPFVPVRR